MRRSIAALRHTAALVVALLPAAGMAVAITVFGPRLGAQIAVHWGANSVRPDGFAATWGATFWVSVAGTALAVIAAVAAVVVHAFAANERPWRMTAAGATAAGGILAFTWVVGAWATADAPTPAQAALGWRMLLFAAPIAAGAAVWMLLPNGPADAGEPARRPYLQLAPGERAAWTGVITSRLLVVLTGAVFVVMLVVLGFALASGGGFPWSLVILPAVVVLVLLVMVPVRLTVDRRGIRLVSVLLRVPLIRVRLGNIRQVTVDTIRPVQWGGWGYRVSAGGRAGLCDPLGPRHRHRAAVGQRDRHHRRRPREACRGRQRPAAPGAADGRRLDPDDRPVVGAPRAARPRRGTLSRRSRAGR